MRSIRRALRLIVATGALLPLLASAPAEASIEDCAGYTDSAHPTYVRISENGLHSTIVACVGVGADLGYPAGAAWPIVGVFLTPSETQLTTYGTEHAVRLGGGVCVTFHAPFMMSECLHDPSFAVAAGQYEWGWEGYGPGTVTYGHVMPCIDDTTPSGNPSLFGYGVGAACLSVGFSAREEKDLTKWYVLPGVCLRWTGTYTCYFLHSWTTVDGAATSQEFAVCKGVPGTDPPPCTYVDVS